jgi:dTDP-4-dehydrorhamnose reductase
VNTIKNILVTGANGQLGMELRQLASAFPQYRFLFVARDVLSIDDTTAVTKYFEEHEVDACINCAAYTAVDKAEEEQASAISINATAVGNIAACCKNKGALFVHFSTDYVFNGNAAEPYKETHSTDPVNFYGQTKLMGEQAAIKNNPESIIIRTSWVYSRFGKNFVKTMLRLMAERESIGVVADQYGCPTYAADLAAAVMTIIDGKKYTPGIYHYCNKGVINWHQFALAIRELAQQQCIVNAIHTSNYPTPAKRPAYSALDTATISETFGIKIPEWKESLAVCIAAL